MGRHSSLGSYSIRTARSLTSGECLIRLDMTPFSMQAVNPQLLPEGIKKCWRMERILLGLCRLRKPEDAFAPSANRLSQAKFPWARTWTALIFKGSPVNEEQIRHLYQGSFVSDCRNLVFIGARDRHKNPLGHRHRPTGSAGELQGPLLNLWTWPMIWSGENWRA